MISWTVMTSTWPRARRLIMADDQFIHMLSRNRATLGIVRSAQEGVTMSSHMNRPDQQLELRLRAQSSLGRDTSSGAVSGGSAAALGVLLDLATSPVTAADALAVLHELQVHQVELALQAEEMRTTTRELEIAMARQVQLYDCAPVAMFTVDAQLCVLEANLTGAQLLTTDREVLMGMNLGSFLSAPSADRLRGILSGVQHGFNRSTLDLTLLATRGAWAQDAVHVSVNVDPVDGRYIVAFMEVAAESER